MWCGKRGSGRIDPAASLLPEPAAEMVGVTSLVSQQAPRWLDALDQSGGSADIGDVAGHQDKGDRLASSIGQSMDRAGPSTA
jgi:hypothetical protein